MAKAIRTMKESFMHGQMARCTHLLEQYMATIDLQQSQNMTNRKADLEPLVTNKGESTPIIKVRNEEDSQKKEVPKEIHDPNGDLTSILKTLQVMCQSLKGLMLIIRFIRWRRFSTYIGSLITSD